MEIWPLEIVAAASSIVQRGWSHTGNHMQEHSAKSVVEEVQLVVSGLQLEVHKRIATVARREESSFMRGSSGKKYAK